MSISYAMRYILLFYWQLKIVIYCLFNTYEILSPPRGYRLVKISCLELPFFEHGAQQDDLLIYLNNYCYRMVKLTLTSVTVFGTITFNYASLPLV